MPITANVTHAGHASQSDAREARPADGGHHDPDDERVHRVQAGHRCVLIGGKRDQPAVVADRPGLDERVAESPLREHARGCRRHQDVAEEAHEIRADEPVAEVGEPLVVPEVDPEQRDPDDGELREPVRVGGGDDEKLRLLDEVLDTGLDERLELVLGLDHERAVPERLGDATVRSTARRLVDGVEAEPQRDLQGEVRPAAREPACLRVPGQALDSIQAARRAGRANGMRGSPERVRRAPWAQ